MLINVVLINKKACSEQNSSCRTIRKLHFASCFSRIFIAAPSCVKHKQKLL